jgi:hypothetical protein
VDKNEAGPPDRESRLELCYFSGVFFDFLVVMLSLLPERP